MCGRMVVNGMYKAGFGFIDVNLLEKNFWMERMVVLAFKRKLQANHVLFPIFSIAGSKNSKIRASFFGHMSQNSKLSEANFVQHRSRGHLPTSSCRKQLLSDARLQPAPAAGS